MQQQRKFKLSSLHTRKLTDPRTTLSTTELPTDPMTVTAAAEKLKPRLLSCGSPGPCSVSHSSSRSRAPAVSTSVVAEEDQTCLKSRRLQRIPTGTLRTREWTKRVMTPTHNNGHGT